MINWTSPHNLIGLFVLVAIIAFAWRQLGAKVAPLGNVVRASFGG